MDDNPKWQVARLDDIERRGRDIPVREHLGIQAFGINAFTPGDDGLLISEHDEAGSGQEELYLVLDGNATLRDRRRDGRRAGRDLRVRPAGGTAEGDRGRNHPRPRRRARRGVPGDRLGRGVVVPPRVDDRLWRAALRRRGRSGPPRPRAQCRTTPASTTTARALRPSPETRATRRSTTSSGRSSCIPRFREQARADDDFAAVRDDPRFEELFAEPLPARESRARPCGSRGACCRRGRRAPRRSRPRG